MCIAVPVEILEIEDDGVHAKVDYGGIKKRISLMLVKDQVKEGDYVIVHAGAAIQRIDAKEAEKTLELMNELLEFQA